MTHTLKISEAGEMHSITLGGISSYYIFTKAGFFRGGNIYFSDKILRVLSGELEYISEKDGLDVHTIFSPESGEQTIARGVPHIFKALSDCVFIESFSEDTKSEEYEKYSAMKK